MARPSGRHVQWFESTDGRQYAPLTAATNAALTVSPSATAYYFVRVTNGSAAINSDVAIVRVTPAAQATPSYRALTEEVSFAPGGTATLEVRAAGSNVHYQWFKSDPAGSAFVAAGGDSPRLTDTPSCAEALYYVRIGNEASFVDTPVMVARSTACAAPAVTSQPRSASIHAGTAATLDVTATGDRTLTYQWFIDDDQRGWLALHGATSHSITVTPSETHFYYCVITNPCGNSVSSATAAVEVIPQ
jgi:hypothetical protein